MWSRLFSRSARVTQRVTRNAVFTGHPQSRFHSAQVRDGAWNSGVLFGAGALGLTCAYLTSKAFAENEDPNNSEWKTTKTNYVYHGKMKDSFKNDLFIFSGSGHPALAKSICDYLGVELQNATVSRFNDNEINIQINRNVRGKKIFIIQSTCPPVNDNLMELLLFISAARRASASSICAVIPYYGYGRITEVGTMHNCLTGADVAEMLQAAGVNSVVSVDLYKEQLQGFFTPSITVDSIPVAHLLAAYVMETEHLDSPVVLAANAHNVYRAKAFREALDLLKCPNTYMGMAIEVDRSRSINVDKSNNDVIDASEREADSKALQEDYSHMENTHEIVGEISGKDVIIVDNYSLTGDTLCRVAKVLKENGARKINVVVTHGLYTEDGVKQLEKAPIDRIISTNTVPDCALEKSLPKFERLNVAPLLAEVIRSIYLNQSVSPMYHLQTKEKEMNEQQEKALIQKQKPIPSC